MGTRSIRRFFYGFIGAVGVILAAVALFMLSRTAQNSQEFDQQANSILLINIAGLLILLVLMIGNLARLVRDYRAHVPGSKLKARMVGMFVGLAVVPLLTLVSLLAAAVIGALLFRREVWCRHLCPLGRLATAVGAQESTLYGLAGIGDMITTCISRHSRNRNFGEAVTRGDKTPQELLDESIQVVEGVHMAKAALKLSEKLKVELPITKQVHDVLFSGKPPRQAMRQLMERELRPELD